MLVFKNVQLLKIYRNIPSTGSLELRRNDNEHGKSVDGLVDSLFVWIILSCLLFV